MKNIVCFGEVLWDVFPDHKKIGGAPLNVGIRLQSLDNKVAIISSIGEDKKGKKIVRFIKKQGVAVNDIQVEGRLKTGKVMVTLNQLL